MTIHELTTFFKLDPLASDKGNFWFPVLEKLEVQNPDYIKIQQRIIAFMREYRNLFFEQFVLEFDQTSRLPNTQVAFDEAYFVKVANHLKSACVRATIERIKEGFVGPRGNEVIIAQDTSQDIKMKIYPQSINQDVETILEFDCSIKVPEIEKDRHKLLRNDIMGEYDLQSVTLTLSNMFKLGNLQEIQPGLEIGHFCAHQRHNFRPDLQKQHREKISVHKCTNGEMIQVMKESYSQSLLSLVFHRLTQTLDRENSGAVLRFFKITNTTEMSELRAVLSEDLSQQVERFTSPIKFEMLSNNQNSCCFVTLALDLPDESVVLHLSTCREAVVVQVFDAKLKEKQVKMTVREELARIILSKDCSLAQLGKKLQRPAFELNFHQPEG